MVLKIREEIKRGLVRAEVNILHQSGKYIAILCTVLLLAVTPWVGVLPPAETAAGESIAWTPGQRTMARLATYADFNPLAGAISYDIYLNGVQLGSATIDLKKHGQDFILQVVGKVRSIISKLFTIRYRGHAVMSPDPVQPSEARIEEHKGSKMKTFLLKFPEPNRASTVQIEENDGKTPIRTHKEFVSESFVLDPFSTVFFIRSINWQVGDKQVFDILTGKKQYELKLDCQGEKVLAIDGKPRDTWEIVLESRSLEEPRKIKLSGVIYLSKDPSREILKVNGKHKFGKIVAHMRQSGQEAVQ